MTLRSRFRAPSESGASLLIVLILTSVFIVIVGAATQYSISHLRFTRERIDRELALTIAEAGANYYRWHLAHVPDDFQDGTGAPGPYVHEYRDASGDVVGTYSLEITPPPSGSTIVTIVSTGWANSRPNMKRTVALTLGVRSLTQYAVVANDIMRFGEGTEIWGPVHSNRGVRLDGYTHNIMTASVPSYNDPDHGGNNEFGVHTHVTQGSGVDQSFRPKEAPPGVVEVRADVFGAGRSFPVPEIDFNGITLDMAQMKTVASDAGIYLSASGGYGYRIHFNTNDTVDIRRVTTLATCRYRHNAHQAWTNYADIFSISTEASFTYKGVSSIGLPLPANGLIFVEDDVWVDGQIDGARVTVVAAREPLASGTATIVVNNDLKYTNYDGTDAIGLIAQTDVSAGYYSEDDIQIDGALIAQKGRVGRYYYAPHPGANYSPNGCEANIYRDTLTLNGSIATNQRYGFAYTDGTGYAKRNLNFDTNMVFAPPPFFPTTGEYTVLAWEER